VNFKKVSKKIKNIYQETENPEAIWFLSKINLSKSWEIGRI